MMKSAGHQKRSATKTVQQTLAKKEKTANDNLWVVHLTEALTQFIPLDDHGVSYLQQHSCKFKFKINGSVCSNALHFFIFILDIRVTYLLLTKSPSINK